MNPWVRSAARSVFLAGVFAITVSVATSAEAAVLAGPIQDVKESTGSFCWGDGPHDLCQQWSYRTQDSGWFYGSSYGWSNADIYVARGLADPTTTTNAESFSYSTGVDWAGEGDTVFFHGVNGYFGAWQVIRVDPLSGVPDVRGTLTGQWYFQTDGSGCFAANCGTTPVAHSTWGRVKAIYR